MRFQIQFKKFEKVLVEITPDLSSKNPELSKELMCYLACKCVKSCKRNASEV